MKRETGVRSQKSGWMPALAALAGLACSGVPLAAHHAFAAEFDINKPVTLKGKVTRMEWVNPHSWIHLEVVGPDGKVTEWMVEGGSPNVLLRRGFSKTSLPEGTEVMVEGFQAKNGLNRANGANITLPDGRRVFIGGSTPQELPQK